MFNYKKYSPFTSSEHPGKHSPKSNNESDEHCSRTDNHECLKDELGSEIHFIHSPNAPRPSVREQF